ncbi:Ras-related protein Rab-10 [Stylophora pistillata]|uniref:Ras-related protein Rab-10 n=1 Tax=Stylophora pistillata TaxID=50429 RepID=A0A2B4SB37_STYPI|nr:Ras-related protein Rab-10 [Stylophora pistillata]
MAEATSEFKIVIVGGSGVGKSSVVKSFCGNVEEDLEGQKAAADQQVVTKRIEIQGKDISLKIIDTAGSVLENQVYTRKLYKGAKGIMVIYDVTHKRSFEDVPKWLQDIDEFATDHGVYFLEVSGNTGVQVKEAFDLMTEEILLTENHGQATAQPNRCYLL